MSYYWIDPILDPRWADFIYKHPDSSIFHTPGWLQALKNTYGYEPIVLTTSSPTTALENGIAFCRVRSRLTGVRLVSLPFSDHCQPLSASSQLLASLPELCRRDQLKYIELRPLLPIEAPGLSVSVNYLFHLLDLRPSLDDIFRKFHADCVRRKIRRAERDGLEYESGQSNRLIDEFFSLQVMTRRKHGLPPQPREWFRNVLAYGGENAVIRVARLKGRAISAILTLQHKRTAVYKYGCSDMQEANRGGMQLVLWKAIEEAKKAGMDAMDLGRGDLEGEGLALFKERFGAQRQTISYLRHPASHTNPGFGSAVIRRLPKAVLILAGRLLYRHMG